MLNLPLEKRFVLAPVILVLISVLIYLTPLQDLFEFNRTLISQGEYWRIISGHFSHSNVFHLILNIAGIVLIWALHGEYYNAKKYSLSLTLLALYSGIALYVFYPDIQIYNGLSGVLHGLIVVGALIDCQRKMTTGYLLFIGIWLKIILEQQAGPDQALGELIEARVAIEAHLVGAIAGIFVYAKLNMHTLRQQLKQ